MKCRAYNSKNLKQNAEVKLLKYLKTLHIDTTIFVHNQIFTGSLSGTGSVVAMSY